MESLGYETEMSMATHLKMAAITEHEPKTTHYILVTEQHVVSPGREMETAMTIHLKMAAIAV